MKVIKILIISFSIVMLLSQNIYAIDSILDKAKNWFDTGKDNAGIGLDTAQVNKYSNNIYNLLLIVAVITAVIVGAILGIQFMTAGVGSKAEIKTALYPYIISCVVVFGSLGIWKLVVSIAKNLTN